MPHTEWLLGFGFFIINHSSPQPSLWVRMFKDASLVSLDILLPFYHVPRILSQTLCDKSNPSHQSSLTLTWPQLHKGTPASSKPKKMIKLMLEGFLTHGSINLSYTRSCIKYFISVSGKSVSTSRMKVSGHLVFIREWGLFLWFVITFTICSW